MLIKLIKIISITLFIFLVSDYFFGVKLLPTGNPILANNTKSFSINELKKNKLTRELPISLFDYFYTNGSRSGISEKNFKLVNAKEGEKIDANFLIKYNTYLDNINFKNSLKLFKPNINKKNVIRNLGNTINIKYDLCTNNYGFKSSCIDKIIPKNLDYVFLGDSQTEGIGLNYEETFVGKLNNFFEKKTILNAGIEDQRPYNYIKKIEYLLKEKFTFSEVFLVVDLTDVHDEWLERDVIDRKVEKRFEEIKLKDTNSFLYKKELNVIKDNKIENKIIKEDIKPQFFIQIKKIISNILIKSKSFIRHFPSMHYAFHRLKNSRYPEPYWIYTYNNSLNTSWSYDDQQFKDTIEHIDRMIKHVTIVEDILNQNNIKFNLILLPHPVSLFHGTLYNKTAEIFKNFCINRCNRFINIYSPLFKDKNKLTFSEAEKLVSQYYLEGDFHFNKKGHDLIFKEILEDL